MYFIVIPRWECILPMTNLESGFLNWLLDMVSTEVALHYLPVIGGLFILQVTMTTRWWHRWLRSYCQGYADLAGSPCNCCHDITWSNSCCHGDMDACAAVAITVACQHSQSVNALKLQWWHSYPSQSSFLDWASWLLKGRCFLVTSS